eukprot:1785329-Lingulodinium_polyedra.AAC.1
MLSQLALRSQNIPKRCEQTSAQGCHGTPRSTQSLFAVPCSRHAELRREWAEAGAHVQVRGM